MICKNEAELKADTLLGKYEEQSNVKGGSSWEDERQS